MQWRIISWCMIGPGLRIAAGDEAKSTSASQESRNAFDRFDSFDIGADWLACSSQSVRNPARFCSAAETEMRLEDEGVEWHYQRQLDATGMRQIISARDRRSPLGSCGSRGCCCSRVQEIIPKVFQGRRTLYVRVIAASRGADLHRG